jgi:AraC family transcriptional regulator
LANFISERLKRNMQQIVRHIRGLVDTIEENLSDDINILQLARSFGISPWHFQRLFKALTGDTLGGYVRGRRLTEAVRLLTETELAVIDISYSVGFNSHEAFTRSFKSYFGQAPQDFRKNRPSVILNEKPLLDTALVRHLREEVNLEPLIVTTPQQTVVGMDTPIPSPFLAGESYCESLWPAWMTLLKRQGEIKHRQAAKFYGITASASGNFTEDALHYISGVPVASAKNIPIGMVTHAFPEQLVAMFKMESIDIETADRTMNYIYGYWLPNSPYDRGTGSDYELFEETKGFIDPGLGSHYVIPIIHKA